MQEAPDYEALVRWTAMAERHRSQTGGASALTVRLLAEALLAATGELARAWNVAD